MRVPQPDLKRKQCMRTWITAARRTLSRRLRRVPADSDGSFDFHNFRQVRRCLQRWQLAPPDFSLGAADRDVEGAALALCGLSQRRADLRKRFPKALRDGV